jgi:hypothetical protein
MQPTKHMDPSENELIAHIKDSLMSHEESYVPGAWEKFKAKDEKKKPLIFWIGPLSSAAAILFIATGLYFFISKTSDKPDVQIVKTSPYRYNGPKPEKTITPAEMPKEVRPVTPAEQVEAAKAAIPAASNLDYTVKNTNIPVSQTAAGTDVMTKVSPPSATVNPTKSSAVLSGDPVAANEPAATSAKETPEKKAYSFQEFLNNESVAGKESKPVAIAAVKENKWAMGVLVAPSFGNTKRLNMGYGVSMDYAVSDKISLGSGISYNELAASRDISSSPTGMMDSPSGYNTIARSTKNLESVEAKISGIDIPFEVKYHFSKKLYANVGVSAFAVINHQQNNSYVEQKLVERETSLTAGSKDSFTTFMVAEKTTEKAPEAEVSNDKYLGFYNFSFGYKQKISKSKSVSVEPFMKVPMKEVSKENLRLMGTGVRLKFDF